MFFYILIAKNMETLRLYVGFLSSNKKVSFPLIGCFQFCPFLKYCLLLPSKNMEKFPGFLNYTSIRGFTESYFKAVQQIFVGYATSKCA